MTLASRYIRSTSAFARICNPGCRGFAHGFVGYTVDHFSGVQFRARGVCAQKRAAPSVADPRGVIHQALARLRFPVCMSASIHCIAWEVANRLAECSTLFRIRNGRLQRLPVQCLTACAAMPTRPPSKSSSAMRGPWPSSPKRFSSGTSQSVKLISAVREVRRPILSS